MNITSALGLPMPNTTWVRVWHSPHFWQERHVACKVLKSIVYSFVLLRHLCPGNSAVGRPAAQALPLHMENGWQRQAKKLCARLNAAVAKGKKQGSPSIAQL